VVDAHDPHGHDVSDADDVVRALDVTIGKLTDVYQPRVLEADVDEGPEVDHVEHRPLQFHTGCQVLEFEDPLLEDGFGKILARVAIGPAKSLDDIFESEFSDAQLSGKLCHACLGQLGAQLGQLLSISQDLGSLTKHLEQAGCRLVALGMDPGSVERVIALGDLQESGGLGKRRWPDAFHLGEQLSAGKRSLLLAILDDSPGSQLVEAGYVAEQGNAGGVQINTHEVDATADDGFQRLLELLRADIMLIEPDADVLGFDLHQLSQGVLEPPSDRDRATKRGIVLGQLFPTHLARRIDAGAGLVDDDVGELSEEMIGRMRRGGSGRWWRSSRRFGARSTRSTWLMPT
jgi:hypothetical protein